MTPCESLVDLYDDDTRQHEARRHCQRCPVLADCRARVLRLEAAGEPVWGVAGGMLPSERPHANRYAQPSRSGLVELAGMQPCGTTAAAARHRKAGEPLCPACVHARRLYDAGRRKPQRVAS